jgi:hypothetical protein
VSGENQGEHEQSLWDAGANDAVDMSVTLPV